MFDRVLLMLNARKQIGFTRKGDTKNVTKWLPNLWNHSPAFGMHEHDFIMPKD